MILQDALHSALPTIQSDLSAPELNPTHKYNILINFIKSKIPLKKDKSPSKHNSNKPHLKLFSPAPWWNDFCEEALLNRKQAMSSYKKNPSLKNYINFKKQEALSKKIFKKEKREGWKEFCHSSYNSSISHVWKFIKRYKNRYLNTFTPSVTINYDFPRRS